MEYFLCDILTEKKLDPIKRNALTSIYTRPHWISCQKWNLYHNFNVIDINVVMPFHLLDFRSSIHTFYFYFFQLFAFLLDDFTFWMKSPWKFYWHYKCVSWIKIHYIFFLLLLLHSILSYLKHWHFNKSNTNSNEGKPNVF